MSGQSFEELLLIDLERLYENGAGRSQIQQCNALLSLWPLQLTAPERSDSQRVLDLIKLLEAVNDGSESDHVHGGAAITGIQPLSERKRERTKRQEAAAPHWDGSSKDRRTGYNHRYDFMLAYRQAILQYIGNETSVKQYLRLRGYTREQIDALLTTGNERVAELRALAEASLAALDPPLDYGPWRVDREELVWALSTFKQDLRDRLPAPLVKTYRWLNRWPRAFDLLLVALLLGFFVLLIFIQWALEYNDFFAGLRGCPIWPIFRLVSHHTFPYDPGDPRMSQPVSGEVLVYIAIGALTLLALYWRRSRVAAVKVVVAGAIFQLWAELSRYVYFKSFNPPVGRCIRYNMVFNFNGLFLGVLGGIGLILFLMVINAVLWLIDKKSAD